MNSTKTGWQLTDDAQLEPGSCRVETASNQIDAQLPTRWKRLVAALGKDSDWLGLMMNDPTATPLAGNPTCRTAANCSRSPSRCRYRGASPAWPVW